MNLQKLSLALLAILLVGSPVCWLMGALAGGTVDDSTESTPANPTVVPSPTVVSSPTAEPTTAETTEEPTPEPTSTAAPQVLPTRTPSPTPPTAG
jgi:hypothetical protein